MAKEKVKFKSLMKMINFCLNFIGFNILHRRRRRWFSWRTAFIWTTMSSVVVFSLFIGDIELKNRNMNIISTCGVLLFGGGVVYVKLNLLIFFEENFRESSLWLERTFHDIGHELLDALWRPILEKCVQTTVIVQRFLYCTFFGFSIAIVLFRVIQDPENLPLEFYLPYTNQHMSPFYEINYIYQVFVLLIIIHSATAMDGFFVTVINFSTARFELLIQSLNLLDDTRGMQPDMTDFNKMKLIRTIVQIHCDALWAVSQFSKMYEIILLIQVLASVGAQVFTFYIIQEDKSNLIMWFVMIATIIQIFLYCLFGNQLVHIAEKMSDEIYCTSWYTMELIQRKTLLMILKRAQKPVGLSIGGFEQLSLASFITIVKTAFSYCAVLQSLNMHA